jgi:hypothetical protein
VVELKLKKADLHQELHLLLAQSLDVLHPVAVVDLAVVAELVAVLVVDAVWLEQPLQQQVLLAPWLAE